MVAPVEFLHAHLLAFASVNRSPQACASVAVLGLLNVAFKQYNKPLTTLQMVSNVVQSVWSPVQIWAGHATAFWMVNPVLRFFTGGFIGPPYRAVDYGIISSVLQFSINGTFHLISEGFADNAAMIFALPVVIFELIGFKHWFWSPTTKTILETCGRFFGKKLFAWLRNRQTHSKVLKRG
jgi:hypothetical protein